MALDTFAGIAANGIGGNAALLCDPQPIPHEKRPCTLHAANLTPCAAVSEIETAEELTQALHALRAKMAPFMTNHAAPVPSRRRRLTLQKFELNGQFITLPHYGAPAGDGRQEYHTTFSFRKTPGKVQFLHFEGVDYWAEVLLNGKFIGAHEGFFAAFEFDATPFLRDGVNELTVVVRNDYIFGGNDAHRGGRFEGDKLYAATGLGWDDPELGWHHCPPGMGIWGAVYLEERDSIFVSDLAVRPLTAEHSAEVTVEVYSNYYEPKPLKIEYQVLPRNFVGEPVCSGVYEPTTVMTVGRGDTLTESDRKDILGMGTPLDLKHGINVYTFRVPMGDFRTWDRETPYLYNVQVQLEAPETQDTAENHFGMRAFRQDTESETKGMYYLNEKPIRLRGANTMGFEQQDVLRGDIDQLIDDILLAKLCHMNFLRITQRPVQQTVYDYCDMLGLMVQTDLPLFGCMRRTKVCEGIRQAEEMERLIRSHPCAVVVTYINEPFPNANNEPHRHLRRDELQQFFYACDFAVHLQNPDRVIKHVDGDYDPPSDSMPDNHCYPMWYNAHGIDIGRLNKGEWLSVRPGWYYGCGEYGAEGLDSAQVMDRYYPKEWLKEPFDPHRIVFSQTASFQGMFYDAQDTRADWIAESQRYQALATRMMTEAFRRDDRMVSFAIHLFIDAFPSGWMKAIMDCDRVPKQAYFAYRHALSPVLLSLRTDRFAYYCGEPVHIESWVCNDTLCPVSGRIRYELYQDGVLCQTGEQPAEMQPNRAGYVGETSFAAPEVADRAHYTLRAVLLAEDDTPINENTFDFDVFAHVSIPQNPNVELITNLAPGQYTIAGCPVQVKACAMLPVHFVSRKTGHPAVAAFQPTDFRFFYNKETDRIDPLLSSTFQAPGFTPILLGCNSDEHGEWGPALAAAEREENGRRTVICNVDLRLENPVAERFLAALMR